MSKNMKREKRRNNSSPGSVQFGDFGVSTIAVAFFFLFFLPQGNAQSTVDFLFKSYGLEKETDNIIQNAEHLNEFFENLYQQKNLNDRRISIIHIGDSHIQADYMTAVVRRNFQNIFGNAGRGLIVPCGVAGTNEPYNFISRSDVKWISKRCVHTQDPLPIGIGGITIRTMQPDSNLEILMNDLWMDYSFNSITLFYQNDTTSFDFSILDTTNVELIKVKSQRKNEQLNYATGIMQRPVNRMIIKSVKSGAKQTQATIFGINLENGKNGLLYHAIGVNGAKYEHYNAAFHFAEQTSVLKPELFIVSLGTNESMAYFSQAPLFLQQIDKLVTTLQSFNPQAKFILVTPPDAYRKKIKHNPGVGLIRQQILQYAVENGFAFYDMYNALGGDRSADAWRQAGFLRPDGVHFTKEGYEYQGNLFFHAILKRYNQYVPLRHP